MNNIIDIPLNEHLFFYHKFENCIIEFHLNKSNYAISITCLRWN
jgi:hypothetical protein